MNRSISIKGHGCQVYNGPVYGDTGRKHQADTGRKRGGNRRSSRKTGKEPVIVATAPTLPIPRRLGPQRPQGHEDPGHTDQVT
ncbi:hypothetical protein ACI65C_004440 [Semiaphis heraclei]